MHLNELRRNPNTNTVGKGSSLLGDVLSKYGEGDCFLNFTTLPKLGINPKSTFNTPLGVYAYTFSNREVQHQFSQNRLPFAGDRKFINILVPAGNVLRLNSEDHDWIELRNKAFDLFYTMLGITDATPRKVFEECALDASMEDVWGRYGAKARDSGARKYWSLTRLLSILLSRYKEWTIALFDNLPSAKDDVDELKDDLARAGDRDSGYSGTWNHFLRGLGWDAIIDYGDGIIHMNEPSQAVFLSPQGYSLVERLPNPHNRPNATTEYNIVNSTVFAKVFDELIKTRNEDAISALLLAIIYKKENYSALMSKNFMFKFKYSALQTSPRMLLSYAAMKLGRASKGVMCVSVAAHISLALKENGNVDHPDMVLRILEACSDKPLSEVWWARDLMDQLSKPKLSEARSKYAPDPSVTQRSSLNNLNAIKPYLKDGYFASFTQLPKLGINPKSKFSTPIGVYAYPLGNEEISEQVSTNTLPFAADRPFINVFQVTGNIIDLDTNEKWPWTKAADYFLSQVKVDMTSSFAEQEVEKIRKMLLHDMILIARETAYNSRPASIFWNYTRMLANLIEELKKHDKQAAFKGAPNYYTSRDLKDDLGLFYSGTFRNKTSPIRWSKIFLAMGIDGFVDTGGVIHKNEPIQAVIVNPSKIRLVTRIDNEWNPNNQKRLVVNNQRTLASALGMIANSWKGDEHKTFTLIHRFMMNLPATIRPFDENSNRPVIVIQRRISADEYMYEYAGVIIRFLIKYPDLVTRNAPRLPELFGDILGLMAAHESNHEAIKYIAELIPNKEALANRMESKVISLSRFTAFYQNNQAAEDIISKVRGQS